LRYAPEMPWWRHAQVKDWGSGKPSDLGSLEVDSVRTVSGDPLAAESDRPFYEQLARHLEICQVRGRNPSGAAIWTCSSHAPGPPAGQIAIRLQAVKGCRCAVCGGGGATAIRLCVAACRRATCDHAGGSQAAGAPAVGGGNHL